MKPLKILSFGLFFFVLLLAVLVFSPAFEAVENEFPRKISQENTAPQEVVSEEEPAGGDESTLEEPPAEPASDPIPQETPSAAPISPSLPVQQQQDISYSEINDAARRATVNILCTSRLNGKYQYVSGSGVLIDERGVILTNAHIGQYLLLKDHPVPGAIECVVRTGSPAQNAYTVELLYISPLWVTDNASELAKESPSGTGENDFALMRITGMTDSSKSLPASFPVLSPDTAAWTVQKNDYTLLAGYPAGFLGSVTILKNLYLTSTWAPVKELYTFVQGTDDVLTFDGAIVAQEGSSGGAVVSLDVHLVGLIVTRTEGDSTGERQLRAISLSHINRSMLAGEGSSLTGYLSGNLVQKALLFQTQRAPELSRTLIEALTASQ